jgi:hypothetical protein
LGRTLGAGDGALRMARAAAVILWALAVTVVLLVHGSSPHGAHAVAALVSIQADQPAADPCQGVRATHRLHSDPGGGDRPAPWGHCDAVLHRAPASHSGHGGQVLRGCSGPPAPPSADGRSAAPRPAARAVRPPAGSEPARLQVFRC